MGYININISTDELTVTVDGELVQVRPVVDLFLDHLAGSVQSVTADAGGSTAPVGVVDWNDPFDILDYFEECIEDANLIEDRTRRATYTVEIYGKMKRFRAGNPELTPAQERRFLEVATLMNQLFGLGDSEAKPLFPKPDLDPDDFVTFDEYVQAQEDR